MDQLPDGLPDAIELFLRRGAAMETGPLAVYSELSRSAVPDWDHEQQILAHSAPRLRRRRGEEVTVQMQTRLNFRFRHPSTGQEAALDVALTGTVWRMTEHGWRASDLRTNRWASRATCLRQGQQVGKIITVRQVGLGNLFDSLIYLAVANTSDTAAIVGCGCRLARHAASVSDEHGHFNFTLSPCGQRIITLKMPMGLNMPSGFRIPFIVRQSNLDDPPGTTVGERSDLSGGEILVQPPLKGSDSAHRPPRLEQRPILMKLPVLWHRHPLIGRGWCRHSIHAQPIP